MNFLFICNLGGGKIICDEPIMVTSEPDWFFFLLNILITAIIITVAFEMVSARNRKINEKIQLELARKSLKIELTRIHEILKTNDVKHISPKSDKISIEYVNVHFNTLAYQTTVQTWRISGLNINTEHMISEIYSLIEQHNKTLKELEELSKMARISKIENVEGLQNIIEETMRTLSIIENTLKHKIENVLQMEL